MSIFYRLARRAQEYDFAWACKQLSQREIIMRRSWDGQYYMQPYWGEGDIRIFDYDNPANEYCLTLDDLGATDWMLEREYLDEGEE